MCIRDSTTTADDISFQKEAKHGYYACLSYVDAQIGDVYKRQCLATSKYNILFTLSQLQNYENLF